MHRERSQFPENDPSLPGTNIEAILDPQTRARGTRAKIGCASFLTPRFYTPRRELTAPDPKSVARDSRPPDSRPPDESSRSQLQNRLREILAPQTLDPQTLDPRSVQQRIQSRLRTEPDPKSVARASRPPDSRPPEADGTDDRKTFRCPSIRFPRDPSNLLFRVLCRQGVISFIFLSCIIFFKF